MRDFTINDIVKEFARDYPHIPEEVIRYICKHSLNSIIDIVKEGKAQILMKNADIHSVYQEIDVTPIFADLDESRFLNKEELKLAKAQELAGKGIYTTRKRRSNKIKRVYDPRFAAHPVYAGIYPERDVSTIRESEQRGEEVQGTGSSPGE